MKSLSGVSPHTIQYVKSHERAAKENAFNVANVLLPVSLFNLIWRRTVTILGSEVKEHIGSETGS